MASIDRQPELPRFTRFVHAFSLAVLEGMSLGFAAATLAQARRLAQFVMTNRMAAGLRKEMLLIVIGWSHSRGESAYWRRYALLGSCRLYFSHQFGLISRWHF